MPGLIGRCGGGSGGGSQSFIVLSGFTQSYAPGVLNTILFTYDGNQAGNLGTAFDVITIGGFLRPRILEYGQYFASVLVGNAASGYAAHVELNADLEVDAVGGTWSPEAAWYPEIAASAPWMRWTGFIAMNHEWFTVPYIPDWRVFQDSGSTKTFDARLTIVQVSTQEALYDPVL